MQRDNHENDRQQQQSIDDDSQYGDEYYTSSEEYDDNEEEYYDNEAELLTPFPRTMDDDYDEIARRRCGGGRGASTGAAGAAALLSKENTCNCIKCMDEKLGNHTAHGWAPYNKSFCKKWIQIEKKILEEYTKRNGDLAKNDPLRHACGNGAFQTRRILLLTERSFCVHASNPSAPVPYLEPHSGVIYAFGRPRHPEEVKHDDQFCKSFKTPEGMTLEDYRNLIHEFYIHHEQIDTPFAALPRHYALAMACQGATSATLEQGLWDTKRTGCRLGYTGFDEVILDSSNHSSLMELGPILSNTFDVWRMNAYLQRAFVVAKKHAHDLSQITRFTTMSGLQRDMVLAHSGIAGVVISRMFTSPYCIPMMCEKQYFNTRVRFSRFIAKRVHSKQECEIFADNRYGKSGKIRGDPNDDTARVWSWAKSSPDFNALTIETATAELRTLYPNEMPKIMRLVQKCKRGLMNVDEIRRSAEFKRMICMWYFCLKEHMSRQAAARGGGARVKCINEIVGVAAEFPLLFSSEMLILYSSNFSRLVKTTIAAFLRLSSNAESCQTAYPIGCRSALLAFAAVEPRMVDQYLAPELAKCRFDGNDREEAMLNHIPSRCPIFGELRRKYLVHMPRTGDCEWDICRKKGGEIRSFL
jgi:hypothetical protein